MLGKNLGRHRSLQLYKVADKRMYNIRVVKIYKYINYELPDNDFYLFKIIIYIMNTLIFFIIIIILISLYTPSHISHLSKEQSEKEVINQ
jgi:hypothetical protein